jgi:hypothetical protein
MNPEKRRRLRELEAESEAYMAEAKEIFARVQRRREERRARREQGFLRRLFRRAA